MPKIATVVIYGDDYVARKKIKLYGLPHVDRPIHTDEEGENMLKILAGAYPLIISYYPDYNGRIEISACAKYRYKIRTATCNGLAYASYYNDPIQKSEIEKNGGWTFKQRPRHEIEA